MAAILVSGCDNTVEAGVNSFSVAGTFLVLDGTRIEGEITVSCG